MAEVLDQEKSENQEQPQRPEKSERGPEEETTTGKNVLLDEHGEPFADEFDRGPHGHARKRPLYRRPAFLIIAALVLLLGVIFLIRYWLYARSHESTDDAFVDGHIIQVSPKVSGYVSKVYITDNQQVKAGDLLVELDGRDYEAKLNQAKAALDAGLAQQHQAQTQVTLTRASTRANVQQASAGVQQARSEVAGATATASAEQHRTNQAGEAVSAAQANLEQFRAQLAAAEAEAVRANNDVERYQELYRKDEVSRQRLDEAIAAARTTNAQVEAAKQKVTAAEAQEREARSAALAQAANARRAQTQITGARAQVGEAAGRLAQASTAPQQVAVSEAQAASAGANIEGLKAAVEQAELELSYTRIYAPESGRITRKAVEVGALVQVGQPLLAVVPGEVWVIANFKEDQVGKMRPGEPVDITVDAYPDKTFKGHVDSIQAGTGAKFSLIPPENATGNYVKVVQRVPVKIVFDEPLDSQHMLAPGMSVVPSVKVK